MAPKPNAAINPNARDEEMRSAIGDALDSWTIVVAHVCAIFAVATTAQKYEAAAAAFSEIRDFEDHLRMTTSAMKQSFSSNQTVLADWKSICKLLKKVQVQRNKLAHGKLIPVVVEGGGIEYRCLPYFHFFTHKDRDTFEHLTMKDLRKVAAEIRAAIVELAKFGKSIGARQKVNVPTRIFESGTSRVIKRS